MDIFYVFCLNIQAFLTQGLTVPEVILKYLVTFSDL